LKAQVISSSMDGRMVAQCPALWGGWSSALITLSSAVLPLSLSYYSHFSRLRLLCLYIGTSPVMRRRHFVTDKPAGFVYKHNKY